MGKKKKKKKNPFGNERSLHVLAFIHEWWLLHLKDKYTHNTCQIYVKPHSKNTQITLESQIFDEKALR